MLRFYTYEGVVKALEGVSLDIAPGDTFGIVGETGCGKTVTALSVLVLPPPPGKIEKGEQLFQREDGEVINLLVQKGKALQGIRGKEIAMIFQEPNAALNPVYSIGDQICEVLFLHRYKELCLQALSEIEREEAKSWFAPLKLKYNIERAIYRRLVRNPKGLGSRSLTKIPFALRRVKKVARRLAISLLRELEIADPERIIDRYPHELSGGMKQRVVIAMAIAFYPRLLIADELSTSLDVTIQAQILNLIRRLKEELGSSVLYITHNLGIIAEMCDRVGVMYTGNICEVGEVREIFHNPLHPYTKALMEAIPRPGGELKSIPGTVPSLIDPLQVVGFIPVALMSWRFVPQTLPP